MNTNKQAVAFVDLEITLADIEFIAATLQALDIALSEGDSMIDTNAFHCPCDALYTKAKLAYRQFTELMEESKKHKSSTPTT